MPRTHSGYVGDKRAVVCWRPCHAHACSSTPTAMAAELRRRIAEDLRRLRLDAGASQVAIARRAGIDRSVVTRLEAGTLNPTLETYVRLAAALGADYAARVYPNTGPAIRDRHHVRMVDAVIAAAHERWQITPEVGGPQAGQGLDRPRAPRPAGATRDRDRARVRPPPDRAAHPLEHGQGGVDRLVNAGARVGA